MTLNLKVERFRQWKSESLATPEIHTAIVFCMVYEKDSMKLGMCVHTSNLYRTSCLHDIAV